MRLLGNLCLGAVVKICSAVLMVLTWCAQSCSQDLQPEVVWAMPTSARIKCVTTIPGKMTVEYGTTPALGGVSPPEWRDWPNDDVTRHYVNLIGLQPNTQYYYRVRIVPPGGGAEMVSQIGTFRTFRPFAKVLPTVRYSSYLIGGYWSSGDTEAPHHAWNASRYDLNIAYEATGQEALKQLNPNAVVTYYGNITNAYARMSDEGVWARWALQRGVSQEEIALHYAVDTTVRLPYAVNDREFEYFVVWRQSYGRWEWVRFDHYGYSIPNQVGGALYIGHFQRWDIMYFAFSRVAAGGFDGVWEYCSAVDSEGRPTEWTPLTIVEDTTVVAGQKFAQNGVVRFVPPKPGTEWKLCYLPNQPTGGIQWGYYLRFRVTQTGSAGPQVTSQNYRVTGILNEDFVPGDNKDSQTIPGWDVSWETNPANGGDPEYNPNPPSEGGPGVAKSARFKWWSRAWYYRPELRRFMTNLSSPHYVQYRIEEITGLMNARPYLDGWYCDNYGVDVTPGTAVFPTSFQFIEIGQFNAFQYGVLMGEAMERISIELTKMGRISSANNFVSFTPADDWLDARVLSQRDRMWITFAIGVSNQEIRTWLGMYYRGHPRYSSLNTLFAEVAYRVLRRGQYWIPIYAYQEAVRLDKNTEQMWHYEKMSALVYHLLVRDPEGERLFLNAWHRNFFYGEFLTSTTDTMNIYYISGIPKQKAYYIDAALTNLGQPVTTVEPPYIQWVAYPNSWMPGVIPGLFVIHQTDAAPQGKAWYFARRYTNGLVVYRTGDGPADETSMNSATEFDLGGWYSRVRADGSVDPVPINRLNLPSNTGVILIPVTTVARPSVEVVVSVDKPNPKPLDVVTVTIEVRNRGQEAASDVSVRAPLASDATFIQGSLKLDNFVLPDPPVGASWIEVTIPTVPAGQTAVVRFQFVVKPRN